MRERCSMARYCEHCPRWRGSACEGRPVPEPSFAQRCRASGGAEDFSTFLIETALKVLKPRAQLLKRKWCRVMTRNVRRDLVKIRNVGVREPDS